jgi:hypothetical protein
MNRFRDLRPYHDNPEFGFFEKIKLAPLLVAVVILTLIAKLIRTLRKR